jgi:signal-transduction protein with cAMP-binding, CBS, and nucleotidyltransferase domain
MKIKDRIEFKSKAPVMAFAPDDMVIQAVKAMSEKNYGASVIVDGDNKPIGIVTERDFMRRLLAKGLDANTTPISKIMTSDLKLASEEDQVVEWLRVMSNERFRHLPVVDSQGKLVNLMSQGDFVSYTWPQLLTRAKEAVAKSFMERFHLHLIVGGVMFYSIIMVFVMRSVK